MIDDVVKGCDLVISINTCLICINQLIALLASVNVLHYDCFLNSR